MKTQHIKIFLVLLFAGILAAGSNKCPPGNSVDTDNDGIIDSDDNCPDLPNSNQLDIDGDKIGDLCDNCVLLRNAAQVDCDADGKGDVCDENSTCSIEGMVYVPKGWFWRGSCDEMTDPSCNLGDPGYTIGIL